MTRFLYSIATKKRFDIRFFKKKEIDSEDKRFEDLNNILGFAPTDTSLYQKAL